MLTLFQRSVFSYSYEEMQPKLAMYKFNLDDEVFSISPRKNIQMASKVSWNLNEIK